MSLDQYLSIPVLVSAFVLLVTSWFLSVWNQNRKLPPGPWGLPFFGYYPFLSDTPYKDLTDLIRTYGNVFSFRTLGGRLLIVLNGPKTIKEVMVNRADEFTGRPHGSNSISFISDGVGITQEEGEAWREQRRFFLSSAKHFGFGKLELEGRIHDEIRDFLEVLRKSGGKDTNVQYHMAYASNSIISHVLFNKKLPKGVFSKDLMPAFNSMIGIFLGKRHLLIGNAFNASMQLMPSLWRARKARDFIRKTTDGIIEEHIRTLDPSHPRDYVDEYLVQRQSLLKTGKDKEGSFSIQRLQANAMNLFIEGTEAVSFTIASYLAELSKHPDSQKRIQKELGSLIGRERLPSWADRPKLPYLEATIQELQRTATPFLISTMYSNFEETTIEGFRIPARSAIVFNLGSIHFDPENFPDPQKFDPERYLDKNEKKVKREGPFPFGVGKRSCIGESLAQMEVFLFIGAILQNFTLHPGDTEMTLRVVSRE